MRWSTQLEAAHERVLDFAGRCKVAQVCLVEKILPVRRVVIGRECNQRLAGIDGTRHVVLIEAIVIAEQRAIADVQFAETGDRESRTTDSRQP